MKYILHIDTSGDNGFVAIGADGKISSRLDSNDSRNYAATLNLHINQVLEEAGITLQDLTAIAVCGGPGSYTGLRIGLATAKGFCYVLDKPLMMHNKLLLLVMQEYYKNLLKYDFYTAILPARDKEYFISSYNNKLEAIVEPRHIFEADMDDLLARNTSKNLLIAQPNPLLEYISGKYSMDTISNDSIDAKAWARYALGEINCNRIVNLATAEPFYLKDVYTHKPNKINHLP